MANYPDTTWEGDPRAPWNEEAPRACETCVRFRESKTLEACICMLRADMAAKDVFADGADVVDAVERATVQPDGWCGMWEEA